jgi:anti-sigma B factor antagonist
MGERRFFLRGEIDISTAPEVRERFDLLLWASNDDVVIDCCGLAFIDSSGVVILTTALQVLESQGRRLRVTNADRTVEQILELLGLAEPLHVNDQLLRPPEPDDTEAGHARI